jgi:hypothetical protein
MGSTTESTFSACVSRFRVLSRGERDLVSETGSVSSLELKSALGSAVGSAILLSQKSSHSESRNERSEADKERSGERLVIVFLN